LPNLLGQQIASNPLAGLRFAIIWRSFPKRCAGMGSRPLANGTSTQMATGSPQRKAVPLTPAANPHPTAHDACTQGQNRPLDAAAAVPSPPGKAEKAQPSKAGQAPAARNSSSSSGCRALIRQTAPVAGEHSRQKSSSGQLVGQATLSAEGVTTSAHGVTTSAHGVSTSAKRGLRSVRPKAHGKEKKGRMTWFLQPSRSPRCLSTEQVGPGAVAGATTALRPVQMNPALASCAASDKAGQERALHGHETELVAQGGAPPSCMQEPHARSNAGTNKGATLTRGQGKDCVLGVGALPELAGGLKGEDVKARTRKGVSGTPGAVPMIHAHLAPGSTHSCFLRAPENAPLDTAHADCAQPVVQSSQGCAQQVLESSLPTGMGSTCGHTAVHACEALQGEGLSCAAAQLPVRPIASPALPSGFKEHANALPGEPCIPMEPRTHATATPYPCTSGQLSSNGPASAPPRGGEAEEAAARWREIRSKYAAVKCKGHDEPCVLRQVWRPSRVCSQFFSGMYLCAASH
jgi:hypothetical protein